MEVPKMFSQFGTTLDFMIVEANSLAPKPLSQELMTRFGAPGKHLLNRGMFSWKSRPQPHMIRLQSTQPVLNLNVLDHGVADEVRLINHLLSEFNSRLMPGGVHPLATEEKLEYLEPTVGQRMFSRYFSCLGHGWRNTCSSYLDLPFEDDEAFTRLHAAVRVILPIIPALTASSPFIEGRFTGRMSNRFHLETDRFADHPVLCGNLIPEPVFTEKRYRETIFQDILNAFHSSDPNTNGVASEDPDPEKFNRRGAVPFFSDHFLRLRLTDPQECPAADMAVFKLIIEAIRALTQEVFSTHEEQLRAPMGDLTGIIRDAAVGGLKTEVISSGYLAFFGMDEPATIGSIWKHLYEHLSKDPVRPLAMYEHELSVILEQGSLAERLLTVLGENPQPEKIRTVWGNLCDCLDQNRLLIL